MELLVNMTIGGTAAACLILLVKVLLKNKLTPKWHVYIWIILAVRLLVPVLPESGISMLNAVPTAQNIAAVQNELSGLVDPAGSIPERVVSGDLIVKSPVTGMEQKRTFSVPVQNVNFLLLGWMAGAVLMAGWLAGSYWIFSRRAKELPECRDPEILELLKACQDESGVRSENIALRFGGTTPILRGILKPDILIPEGYSKAELRHVLIHELCHAKHHDILVNIACSMMLCVYWFNPIFWICFYTIRRDLEILCDERVIEITGERKEYSRTLLKTSVERNQFLFATTSMQNGEKEVAKRIKQIAYFRKPKLWISVLAAVIVLAAGVVCLTDASSRSTLNVEIGGGYYIKVPENWLGGSGGEMLFRNQDGEQFGGAYASQMESGEAPADLDSAMLPLPNHSRVLERKLYMKDGFSMILVNLDLDAETASQIAERNAAGDLSPSEPVNQNYVFLYPEHAQNEIYTVWADSDAVSERQLIRIAKTFRQSPDPQSFRPETEYRGDWAATADQLLDDYLKNYADADLSISSDISGYSIVRMEPYDDREASWSVIYPGAAVFRVDYTLAIAYPDYYSFAGGGYAIGADNKTKIFRDQLAVFRKDSLNRAVFLGFVWLQDREELGDSAAILHTINYSDPLQSPESLLNLKMPYIGDHTKVGNILRSLPLAQYSTGLELHTKSEPYGLTVNYDMTGLGDRVFDPRPEKAMTDSSGWDANPYIVGQMYKNSMILLSLIDNCSSVEFTITGLSETGVPYTYHYLRDRQASWNELSRDPRSFTESTESFTEFLNLLESVQMGNVSTAAL